MALLDVTIVNVALPSIRSGLHASPASLEWIVSGYSLSYGLALVPGGRAGDRFGAKRLFLIGLTIFTLASVAAESPRTRARSSPRGSSRAWARGCSSRRSARPSSTPSPGPPGPGHLACWAP
jgi:hypothetical protein